jgi:hypothetical protein
MFRFYDCMGSASPKREPRAVLFFSHKPVKAKPTQANTHANLPRLHRIPIISRSEGKDMLIETGGKMLGKLKDERSARFVGCLTEEINAAIDDRKRIAFYKSLSLFL